MHDIERWNQLLAASARIATIHAGEKAPTRQALDEVLSALIEIDAIFPGSIDPVEDIEGYCVRRLSKALFKTLDRLQSPAPGPAACSTATVTNERLAT